jgi:hypothetical protein
MKSISQLLKLSLTLAVAGTSLLTLQISKAYSVKIQATNVSAIQPTIQYTPPPPPKEPPPGGRVLGGARRGICPALEAELTALSPFIQKTASTMDVWGLTTKTHPSFWFYVPLAKNFEYPVEFALQDEAGNPIYKTAIALPDQPGVIAVTLPETVPSLELNKRYRWFFSIYCDPERLWPPIFVEGVIARVNLNQAIAQQLATAKPDQQPAIYAENGIWYETITTLAKLRLKNPQDSKLQAEWRNLLISIGLGEIATQPIVGQ